MLNKRLIKMMGKSFKFVWKSVFMQWISLLCGASVIFYLGTVLQSAMQHTLTTKEIITLLLISAVCTALRFICVKKASQLSGKAASRVKSSLRSKIYHKLLKLGPAYPQFISTSEALQLSAEGIEQLEMYFGRYLPQFFYSLIAPLTLFCLLSFISMRAAFILLICVPLIPISIAAVQTFAKKLLSRYWGIYTNLGDTFLENLQGLTTLKIYESDSYKNEEMNRQAEDFRRITMKVLTMQLNSVSIMDLIAFGGSALGMIAAAKEYSSGSVSFAGCFAIILLSADFFIPLRLLGSYFHIAMNGMAASEKIFKLLDLPESSKRTLQLSAPPKEIKVTDVSFGYDRDTEILHNINLLFPQGSFTALVGESGCGKSTIASLLTLRAENYRGKITIDSNDLCDISMESLMKTITLVTNKSYLFKGTVRENLLIGNSNATEAELWTALRQVQLDSFVCSLPQKMDTLLDEDAANFSGGQKQRLALARVLLHNTPVYIFDEATSNIDIESEDAIMQEIHRLAKTKTVILISHRLANVVDADSIYVLYNGQIAEHGTHETLISKKGIYQKLYSRQKSLEQFGYEEENLCSEAI